MTTIQTARRTRHPVELDAFVKKSCGVTSSGIVTDFSLDGCCVSGFFRIGEQIEISIRALGLFRAQIRWSRMGRAGARFLYEGRVQQSSDDFGKCERGTSTIEYAVLAAGIAVALVAAIGGLGGGVRGTWDDVDTSIPGPSFSTGGESNEAD